MLVPAVAFGAVPVVVLIHGSEHSSARDSYALQRMLPAEGIGVFVYDKRGTGASGGSYTQDYSVLADDAMQAVRAPETLLCADRLARKSSIRELLGRHDPVLRCRQHSNLRMRSSFVPHQGYKGRTLCGYPPSRLGRGRVFRAS